VEYDHVAMQEAFQEERAAGLDARQKRERVIQRAVASQRAHGRFSGAVASFFWEKAATLQDRAHAADSVESIALLQRVNPHLPATASGVKLHEGCLVDLHGQLRRDAEQVLGQLLLPSASANGIRVIQFVVGEGRHSAAVVRDVHPLADAVKSTLRAAVKDGRVKRFQRNGASFTVNI
jgi:DNA-nicking Smr family endonuclease